MNQKNTNHQTLNVCEKLSTNSKEIDDHNKLDLIISFFKAFYPKQYRDNMSCMTLLERGLFAREWKKAASPYDLSTIEKSLRRAVLKQPYMPSLSLFTTLCREIAKQKRETEEDILLYKRKKGECLNSINRSKDIKKLSTIAESALAKIRAMTGAKKYVKNT